MRPLLFRAIGPCIALVLGCHDPTGPIDGQIQVMWHTLLPFSGQSFWLGRPALNAGRLFVQDGNLALGLDAATGAVLWSRPVRHAPSPPLTVLLARDNRVYISEADSVLALDAATGTTIWNFRPDSQAVVAPALDDATLYTGQRGIPVVYALALADGSLRWRTNTGVGYQYGAHVEGVAVSGDTVYANVFRYLNLAGGLSSGVLVALDRRDGHELWRWETSSGVHSFFLEPVVAGRFVLVNDVVGKALHAIDPSTQQEAWHVGFPNNGASRLYLHDGVVYVAGLGGFVYAIDATTGAVRWSKTGLTSASGGAYCGGSFFMDSDKLLRFDATAGRQTGQLGAPPPFDFSSDLATNDTAVYFTGPDGAYRVACR